MTRLIGPRARAAGRPLLRRSLLAAAAALLAASAHAETRIADLREGTNLTLARAPDGGSLVVTLLGGLWRLPAAGGAATALTPPGHGAAQPRFDPAGRRIVYERLVDGQHDLWIYDTRSGEARALTRTAYDERHPDFMPDGETVVFASERTGELRLSRMRVAGGAPEAISNVRGEQTFPTVSERGEIAYVNRHEGRWALRAIAASGADLELAASESPLAAPSWRPGGGVLLFAELEPEAPAARLRMAVLSDQRVVRTLVADEDVFVGRAAWASAAEYVYAGDGRVWRRGIAAPDRAAVSMFAAARIEAVEADGAGPALDAAGPHRAAGFGRPAYAPDGDFGVVTALGDLWRFDARGSRRLTDDAAIELDPALVPGAASVVYASDADGRMRIRQLDLEDGSRRTLSLGEHKAFSPVPAPSGHRVAFLTTTGFGRASEAELRVLLLDRASTGRVLARGLADVRELAWDEVAGEPVVTLRARAAPGSGPLERRVFGLDGRELEPGAATGGAAGAARPLELPELEWRREPAPERYVVQAGRLFDGVGDGYDRHVDIHVRDGRIEAVAARGTRELPERIIDVRDSTVIPGLIDTHAHAADLLGARVGRAWLAYGVTTVRELGADLGAAVARAEAAASGRRPAPRLVVAPTAGAEPPARSLPADSPVRIDRSSRVTSTLAHSVGHAARGGPLPAVATAGSAAADAPLTGLGLPFSPLGRSYEDVESALAASGRYLGTGVAALGSPVNAAPADAAFRRLWTAAERRGWRTRERPVTAGTPYRGALARLIRRGVRVGVGSDAPLTPYGLGLHRELEALAAAGLPNAQVLRLATAEAALALGLGRELGTLEPGKLADFVVIDGDPLERISDARRVTDVVIGGVWHERERLLAGPGE